MAQYGQGVGFNSRTHNQGFALYIARHRAEHGTTRVVAEIGLLLAASLYVAVTAPGVAGLVVVGAVVLFVLSRAARSSQHSKAVVEGARGARYDISCPHCTAGMSVPVGGSIDCPQCACPLTLTQ
jgi:hypothetical protein